MFVCKRNPSSSEEWGSSSDVLCEFSLSCGETETFSFITEDTFIRHLGSLIATIFKRFNFWHSVCPCVRLFPVKNNYYFADGFGQSLMRIYEVGQVVSSDLISIWWWHDWLLLSVWKQEQLVRCILWRVGSWDTQSWGSYSSDWPSSTTTQSMFTGMQSLSAGLVYCSRWELKIQILCQEWSSCGRIVSRDMCWGGWLVNMSRRITVWLLMTDSRCWTHEGADTGTIKEKISVHGDSTSYQQSPSWEGHLDSQESYHGYRPDSGGQRNMCQIIIFGLGSWSQFKW